MIGCPGKTVFELKTPFWNYDAGFGNIGAVRYDLRVSWRRGLSVGIRTTQNERQRQGGRSKPKSHVFVAFRRCRTMSASSARCAASSVLRLQSFQISNDRGPVFGFGDTK